MKRILTPLMLGAAIVAASSVAAEARSNLSIGINTAAPVYYQPAPVYYQPAPVYYAPAPVYYPSYPAYSVYYNNGWERHRHGYDWNYWHHDHGRHNGWRH